MSIVKAKLQQQNSKFISLREVIELLSLEGEGCTKPEAAQYLLQRLQEAGAPTQTFKSPSGLLTLLGEEAENLLIEASTDEFWLWGSDDIPF